jgi:hypothetical protein
MQQQQQQKMDIVKRSDLRVFSPFFSFQKLPPNFEGTWLVGWLVQQRSSPPRNRAHRTSKNGSDGDRSTKAGAAQSSNRSNNSRKPIWMIYIVPVT